MIDFPFFLYWNKLYDKNPKKNQQSGKKVWKLVGCSAGSQFFIEFVTSTFSFVSFVTKVHLTDHNEQCANFQHFDVPSQTSITREAFFS